MAIVFIFIALWAMEAVKCAENAPRFQVNRPRDINVEAGLPSNHIQSICQLQSGYVLIGTTGGIVRYDGLEVSPFYSLRDAALFEGRSLVGIEESLSGHLFIAMNDGIVAYEAGHFFELALPDDLLAESFVAFTLGRAGEFYLANEQGVCFVTDQKGTKITQKIETNLPPPNALWAENDGTLLYATRSGLYRVTTGPSEPERLYSWANRLSADYVSGVFRDNRGWLWMSVGHPGKDDGGVYVVIDGDLHRLAASMVTIENDLSTIRVDREGTLWLGTEDEGAFLVLPRYIETYDQGDGLTDAMVYSVCAGKGGRVWVGTRSGVFLKQGQEPFHHMFAEHEHLWRERYPVAHSVFEASDERLWIGTDRGLFVSDLETVVAMPPLDSPETDKVIVITEGQPGTVFAAANEVIAAYSDESVNVFQLDERLGVVNSLLWSEAGLLWVGTENGLWRLDPQTSHWEKIELESHQGLFEVRGLLAGQGNELWIGAEDLDGALYWDGNQLHLVPHQKGLNTYDVASVQKDEFGNLWFISDHGMGRASITEVMAMISGEKNRFETVVFREAHGLLSTEMHYGGQPGSWRDDAGNIWVATLRGVARFQPKDLIRTEHIPQIYIERVTADGQTLLGLPSPNNRAEPEATDTNRIDHPVVTAPDLFIAAGRGRSVEIRFSSPSFVAPENTKFRYRLEGYDEDWIETMDERTVVYPNLDPGRYRFRVIAASNFGRWNRDGASVNLVVAPMFVQTKTFVALCFAAITGTIFSAHWVRLRFVRQELLLRQQTAIAEDRARIAKDMHDQMGANLTQIAMLGTLAQSGSDTQKAQSNALERIVDKAQEVSDSMKELIWATNPHNDTVEGLLHHIGQHAIEFLSDADIRCRLDFPDDLPEGIVAGHVRNHLYLAAREALNNSVKHAEPSLVRISGTFDGKELRISIRDNGKGLALRNGTPNTSFNGNGLVNMRRRLDEIGGQLHVSSLDEGGTEVAFSVQM